MSKKIAFHLVEKTDYSEFCSEVQDRLNDGWELHGHVIVVPGSNVENVEENGPGMRYLQAFVKDVTPRQRTGFFTSNQDTGYSA